MYFFICLIKSSFIFFALLTLQLPKKWFILKLLLLIYCWPYFIILYLRKKPTKSMLIICIEDFGIGLVKLGQFLATRPDLIGKQMATEFHVLQDSLPAIKYKKISTLIPNGIIVEKTPVATASIAQVYRGTISESGKIVAVKIIKPGIIKQIRIQTTIMYGFGKFMNICFKKFKQLRLLTIISEISRYLKMETDLLMEAAAIEKFTHIIKDANIIIPKVHWQFASKNVLVISWIEGVSLNDPQAFIGYSKFERQTMASSLLICYLGQIYDQGIFHADPHQGNLLVTPDRKIAILDFGRIGFIEPKEKEFLADILHGFVTRDYYKVALAHKRAGYISKNTNLLQFELACLVMGQDFVGKKLSHIKLADVLAKIMNLALEFGIHSQKSLVLFHKTTAMLEGVLMIIDPQMNPWQVAKPWIKRKIIQRYNAKDIYTEFKKEIIIFLKTL